MKKMFKCQFWKGKELHHINVNADHISEAVNFLIHRVKTEVDSIESIVRIQ